MAQKIITFRKAGGASASTAAVQSYYGRGFVNVKDVLAQFGVETLRYKDKKGVWRPLEPGGEKQLLSPPGLSKDKFKVGDVVEVDFQDPSPVARQTSTWVGFCMFLIGCLTGCTAMWAILDQGVRPQALTSLFDQLITFFFGCFCGCFFGCFVALAVMAPRSNAEPALDPLALYHKPIIPTTIATGRSRRRSR